MAILRLLLGGLALRFPSPLGIYALAPDCAVTRTFVGSLYGVSARVEIDVRTRVAQVRLRGVPVAGTVEGKGWFSSPTAEEGPVELDPDFAAALRRRRISIVRAALDRKRDIITVVTRVPIIGEATLRLHPQDPVTLPPLDYGFVPLCTHGDEL